MKCQIYIHDLDVKQEAKFRRLILMSGAKNATLTRFVQDLEAATIWVLSKNSAFLTYAKKRQDESKNFNIWLYDGEQIRFANLTNAAPLSLQSIAAVIDDCFDGKGILVSNENNPYAQQALQSATSEIAKCIQQGMADKQGKLCIALQSAVFLFDFSALTVRYNAPAYEMLWTTANPKLSMNDLKILAEPPDNDTLGKSSSVFLVIWQMTHRLPDQNFDSLLTDHATLKLETWPPFEQVKHQFDDYRIASLLMKKNFTAKQVSELLGVDRASVNMFFNAIYLTSAGKFEIMATAAKTSVVVKNNTLSSLWKKIRNVVGN